MARQRRNPFPDVETVEAIAAGVTADPNAPTGEWVVREGSIWQSSHPVVAQQPEWFCPLGAGRSTAKFWPQRESAS